MNKRMVRKAGAGIVILLTASAMSACSDQQAEPKPGNEPVAVQTPVIVPQPAKAAPETNEQLLQESKKEAIEVASTNNSETGASGQAQAGVVSDKNSAVESKDSDGSKEPRQKVQISEDFDPKKPALMGLSLTSSLNDMVKLYGEATEKHEMADVKPVVIVHQYDGFSVGIQENGTVVFVEVQSAEISTGLNGLKLKQSTQDAVNALGKPDTNTKYVLSYKGNGTILKLDIDPKTDTIQSIKLFANE
ncbi:hypothetical protein [Paenibacillus turpanensis]|uniref:hypothetical protein n=1 Tax=Paenibacillus turpanensis TaxID=2689078 RepID=UPI00140E49C6|nr:hypothetical protein [Paenibacillus turpanensis]